MSRRERRAWIGVLLLAAALRLHRLADRPFHHDESIHGWFSQHLAFEGDYRYDPVYHGPVQYLMVAGTFRLVDLFHKPGDTDLTARLPAALGGVALAAMALLLRARFGKGPALATGTLLALSPNLLYYTRFCREDVWSLLGTAGSFLFLERWWRTRRLGDLSLVALSAAVAFASKENFYVLLALLPPSIVLALLDPGRGLDLKVRYRRVRAVVDENAAAIGGAFLLFFAVSELLYTLFLTHPDSGNPARDAIGYWWSQHKLARVGGPWWYYLPRLLQYEFAILLPAFFWILFRWRRLGLAERFLAGWGITSITMYAYLGEKTPWLLVHQILPFVPLAGLAWAALFKAGLVARALGATLAGASVVTALSLSFWHPVLTTRDPKAESVVYVQSSPEILEVVREIEAAAKSGAEPAAAIAGEASWPMSWYLRHLPVEWALPNEARRPAIAVVDPEKADEAAKTLGPGFRREEVPLRAWWLPEVSKEHPTVSELAAYLFTRRPWSPIGWQNVVVFRRAAQNPP